MQSKYANNSPYHNNYCSDKVIYLAVIKILEHQLSLTVAPPTPINWYFFFYIITFETTIQRAYGSDFVLYFW